MPRQTIIGIEDLPAGFEDELRRFNNAQIAEIYGITNGQAARLRVILHKRGRLL